jgi:hypothetical protein
MSSREHVQIVRLRHRPLPSWGVFLVRFLRNAFFASAFIVISLGGGVWGYHYFAGLGWVDSLLNASMILTGMGPVAELHGETAKIFASLYALYSGVAFLTFVAVLFAPVVHRFLHKFHLDLSEPE